MKLIAAKKQLNEPPEIWLRHSGYALLPENEAGKRSFARRLTRDFYPRFHIYFTEIKDAAGSEQVIFDLHLDQKKPGYAGYNRHNAEYDGEVVSAEIDRLKNLLIGFFT